MSKTKNKLSVFSRKHAALLILLAIDLFMLIYVVAFFLLKDTPFFFLVGSKDCGLWNAHLYCIGCGGTRSVVALSHGDFVESLIKNPYPIVWGFTLIYTNLHTIIRHFAVLKKGGTTPIAPYYGPVLWWALIFSALYYVVLIVLLLCGVDLIGDHGSYWPNFFQNLFS